jgi:hypothetical protein
MGMVKQHMANLIRCLAWDLVDRRTDPTDSRVSALEERLWAAWERRPEVLSRVARRYGLDNQ